VVDDLEPERDLQRDGKRHPPIVTFLHGVLRVAEVVAVEFEGGVPVVVGDREDGPENGLKADLLPPLVRRVLLEELLVRLLLDLDQVRNFDDRRDLAEVPADSPPARDSACHTSSAPRPRGSLRPTRGAIASTMRRGPPGRHVEFEWGSSSEPP